MKKFVFLLLALCFSFEAVNTYNILLLTPSGNKSHKIFYMGFVKELLHRGHHVTVVSAYREPISIANLTEVVIPENLTVASMINNIFENEANAEVMNTIMSNCHAKCSASLELNEVQELKKEEFDVIVISIFFAYCYYSLIHHFQVPYIYVTSLGIEAFTETAGQFAYPSIIPNTMMGSAYPLSFVDRFSSAMFHLFGSVGFYYLVYSKMEDVCKERKLCPIDMPSFMEIDKNVSLIIVNSVRTLEIPISPALPNVVFAGGMQIKEAEPLSDELESWINGSGDAGFIFFSLGSLVKSREMPDKYIKILVDTFASLHQRVLIKWDSEMSDLPDNIRMEKWLPQADILGHSKIRMFITHGGLLSTMEATYHGVPILGLPLFADQFSNINRATAEGWAKILKWDKFTENSFKEVINDILNNEKLRNLAKTRSMIMKDIPIKPAQDAAFWIEYVIRNNGAPHLWSPIYKLSWVELNNLDVWAVIYSSIFILLFVFFYMFKFCCLSKYKQKID